MTADDLARIAEMTLVIRLHPTFLDRDSDGHRISHRQILKNLFPGIEDCVILDGVELALGEVPGGRRPRIAIGHLVPRVGVIPESITDISTLMQCQDCMRDDRTAG